MAMNYNVALKMDIDKAQQQMGIKLNTETQTVSNKMRERIGISKFKRKPRKS